MPLHLRNNLREFQTIGQTLCDELAGDGNDLPIENLRNILPGFQDRILKMYGANREPATERRVACLLDLLDVGRQACIKALAQVAEGPLTGKSSGGDQEISQILEIMGVTLFLAAYVYLDDPNNSTCFDFYFWPGYNSASQARELSRVALKCTAPNGSKLDCGIGFTFTRRPDTHFHHYHYAECVRWFDLALTAIDSNTFQPGGTHTWLSRGSRIMLKDTGLPMEVLMICRDKPDFWNRLRAAFSHSSSEAIDPLHGILTINLVNEPIKAWGHSIARLLNADTVLYRDHSTIRSAVELSWPSPSSGIPCDPDTQRFRECLYNLWLAACFAPEQITSSCAWQDSRHPSAADLFLDRINTNLASAPSALSKDHTYKYWYSLALENTVRLGTMDESAGHLGSVMFLSSHRLAPSFFHNAKKWAEAIFRDIRIYEISIRSLTEGKKAGTTLTSDMFAHEVKRVVRALTETMMRPAAELFDIRVSPKTCTELGNRAGIIEVANDIELSQDAIGITFFCKDITSAGEYIALWCQAANSQDVQRALGGHSPTLLGELVLHAWDRSISALIPFIVGGASDLVAAKLPTCVLEISETSEELRTLFEQPDVTALEVFPNLEWNGEKEVKTQWLGRLFFAVFNNVIVHGNPATKTVLSCEREENGTYRISVVNEKWPTDDDTIVKQLAARGRLPEAAARRGIYNLRRALEKRSGAEQGRFAGRSVIEACADRLNGVVKWPLDTNSEQVNEFRLECTIVY